MKANTKQFSTIAYTNTDLVDKCAVEQAALNYFLRQLDPVEALLDPSKTTNMPLGGNDSIFTLKPYGQEEFTYCIHLRCGLSAKRGEPFIHAFLVANGPGSDGFLYLSKNSKFKIRPEKKRLLNHSRYDHYYSFGSNPIQLWGCAHPSYNTLKPTDLGVSREMAIMLIGMDQPISAGMARNIVAKESYDFDFSMDDQASSSGLSM